MNHALITTAFLFLLCGEASASQNQGADCSVELAVKKVATSNYRKEFQGASSLEVLRSVFRRLFSDPSLLYDSGFVQLVAPVFAVDYEQPSLKELADHEKLGRLFPNYMTSHPFGIASSAIARELETRPGSLADMGCGQGSIVTALGLAFPNLQFYGVDVVPQKIAYGESLAKRFSLGNVEFLLGDMRDSHVLLPAADYYYFYWPLADEENYAIVLAKIFEVTRDLPETTFLIRTFGIALPTLHRFWRHCEQRREQDIRVVRCVR